jgi:hypothetical protein
MTRLGQIGAPQLNIPAVEAALLINNSAMTVR